MSGGAGARVVRRPGAAPGADEGALRCAHARSGALVTVAVGPSVAPAEEVLVLADDDGCVFGVQVRPDPAEALGELADLGVWAVSDDALSLLEDWQAPDALSVLLAQDAVVRVFAL